MWDSFSRVCCLLFFSARPSETSFAAFPSMPTVAFSSRCGPTFSQTGILDWYTVLIGLAALTLHGATWLAYKTSDKLHDRALRAASAIWWVVLFLTVIVTFRSFLLLPRLLQNFHVWPWGFFFPALGLAGLLGIKWSVRATFRPLAGVSIMAFESLRR